MAPTRRLSHRCCCSNTTFIVTLALQDSNMAQPALKISAEEATALAAENFSLREQLLLLQQQATASGPPATPAPHPHAPAAQLTAPFADRPSPPGRLDLDLGRGADAWTTWKQRWDDYAMLTGLHAAPQPIQMAKLRSCLSDEVLRVLRNLQISQQEQTLDIVLEKLRVYFLGQINEVVERRKFNLRCQLEGECFEDFLVALHELSATCNFCPECRDGLTRDRIVAGLRDTAVIKKLCAIPKLTCARAIEICRAEEAAERDLSALIGEPAATSVCRVTRGDKSPTSQDDVIRCSQSGRLPQLRPSPLTDVRLPCSRQVLPRLRQDRTLQVCLPWRQVTFIPAEKPACSWQESRELRRSPHLSNHSVNVLQGRSEGTAAGHGSHRG